MGISTILPIHCDPDRIAVGGYDVSFITAARDYVAKLLRCPEEPELCEQTRSEFVAADIESGIMIYIEPYEPVHRNNVKVVLENAGK